MSRIPFTFVVKPQSVELYSVQILSLEFWGISLIGETAPVRTVFRYSLRSVYNMSSVHMWLGDLLVFFVFLIPIGN